MNARDELAQLIATTLDRIFGNREAEPAQQDYKLTDELIAAGYSKPRTIKTAAELDALPFGAAVQTSDDSDVVVLKAERGRFRNQSGAELSTDDLWRYGTRPFTVIYEGGAA